MKGVAITVLVLAAVIGGMVWLSTSLYLSSDYSKPGGGDKQAEIESLATCEQMIQDRLPSTASADFAGEQTSIVTGKTLTVTGRLTTQSSAGTSTTSQFDCVFVYEPGDLYSPPWKLLSISGPPG